MANLARLDPFTSLTRLDPFETMVRELMPTMLRPSGGEQPAIPIEVQEMDNAYLVAAELPGVRKDAIDISITGNQVTISAEAKREMAADAKSGATNAATESSAARSSCRSTSRKRAPTRVTPTAFCV